MIIRCTAYIGVPKSSIYFVWFERTEYRVEAFAYLVKAIHLGKCFNLAVSTYNYTLDYLDADTAKVSCFVNGRTLTRRLLPEGKQFVCALL